MKNKVSKAQPLGHYYWGNHCEGWNFVAEEGLSVKQERMPAGSSEQMHFHNNSQQFFFMLSGKADFEVEEDLIELAAGEGLYIEAGKKHRIINNSAEAIEFILCSQPSAEKDRINCHEE